MKRKLIVVSGILAALAVSLAGLYMAEPGAGIGAAQVDLTSRQATTNASVQTPLAQTVVPTVAMIQATATMFSTAQTATAAAAATILPKADQIIELPLLPATGKHSAYLAPDGNRIAYLDENALCILDISKVATDVQNAVNAGTEEEYALDDMTDHPEQFPGVACLSVENIKALDGGYLVMSENNFKRYDYSDIWVVDTQTMTLTDITGGVTQAPSPAGSDTPPVDVLPRWMADGRLVFLRYVGSQPPYVYTCQPDGSDLQQAGQLSVSAQHAVSALAVSADEKLLYNQSNNDQAHQDLNGIWISDLDGSHPRQVWHNADQPDWAPIAVDWSPNGTFVAFAMGPDYTTSKQPEHSFWRTIRLSDGQEVLFSPDQYVLSAGWSPDGSSVVYTTSDRDYTTDGLYIAAGPGAPGRMLVSAQTDVKGFAYILIVTTSLQKQLIPWAANNTVMVGRGGAPGILIVRLAMS